MQPLIDDVEEHVGGIGAVREIANLVDGEDGCMRRRSAARGPNRPPNTLPQLEIIDGLQKWQVWSGVRVGSGGEMRDLLRPAP